MASVDITRIAGNIGALNALNSLNSVNKQLALHQARLSSGKRINSAADDPAGLTIATKMNAQDQGLQTAQSNIGDAQNLLSVAESGLSGINDILTEMRNKAQQGASDTMGTDERAALEQQMTAYAKQIDDSVNQTQWNGNGLVDGTYGAGKVGGGGNGTLTFQTGANSGDTTTLGGLDNLSASGTILNLATKGLGTSVGTASDATSLMYAGAGAGLNVSGNGTVVGTELKSGAYTLTVDFTTAASTVANLVDSQGNTIATKTVNTSAGTAIADFGNGMTVDLNSAALATAGGTKIFSQSVGYTSKTDAADAPYTLNGLDASGASSASAFSGYLDKINSAMTAVNKQLSMIGALEGRLNYKSDQVSSSQINVEGAYNRIMNADMASEQVQSSKLSILQQTSTAMLAQANAAPQFLLSLFK